MIAYAYFQHRRLAEAGRRKKDRRAIASAKPASRASRHCRAHHSIATSAVHALPKMDRHGKAA
jgi:hypothetical protein